MAYPRSTGAAGVADMEEIGQPGHSQHHAMQNQLLAVTSLEEHDLSGPKVGARAGVNPDPIADLDGRLHRAAGAGDPCPGRTSGKLTEKLALLGLGGHCEKGRIRTS